MAGGEMAKNKDNIPQSAKYTAATWQWWGIDCAEITMPDGADGVFRVVNAYLKLYRWINPKKHSLQHTLIHRHAMINQLLSLGVYPQVIEIAAGFSPRGASISENKQIQYYELDLPDVVSLKKSQLEKTAKGCKVLSRDNFHQLSNDILGLNFFNTFSGKKSFIISEGLMMYFNRQEQLSIWKAIADFIAENGGDYVFDYIPLEVEPSRSWLGTWLHRVKNFLGGDGQGYCYDARTRWDIRDDLLSAGFERVDVLDSKELAADWQLPYHSIETRVIVYHCQ